MVAKVVTKQLAGEEDLLLGEDSVVQERTNDAAVTITRNSLAKVVRTLAELKLVPVNQPDKFYRYAVMVGSGTALDGFSGTYRYDATFNTLLANDSDIVLAAGSIGCWLLMDKPAADTASNLANLAASINTTMKYKGKMVWDDTNSLPVFATGPTAAAVWVKADGTTAHTPA